MAAVPPTTVSAPGASACSASVVGAGTSWVVVSSTGTPARPAAWAALSASAKDSPLAMNTPSTGAVNVRAIAAAVA